MTDEEARAQAKSINETKMQGEKAVKDAVIKATKQMAKMTRNMQSQGARVEILERHALYMGVGTEFMARVAPLADKMHDDLIEMVEDEYEGKILTALWLAKVFMEVEKSIANYDR